MNKSGETWRESVTSYDPKKGYVDLKQKFPENKYLWNEDFQPTEEKNRNWGAWTYFAIWFGMAVEGVLIFDYVIIRRFKFEIADTFMPQGRFKYLLGVNPAAIVAFILAVFLTYPPSSYLPVSFSLYPFQSWVYQGSWISTILISGIIYILLMKYWVIPKYQPELRGNLSHGYIANDTKKIFEGKGDKQ